MSLELHNFNKLSRHRKEFMTVEITEKMHTLQINEIILVTCSVMTHVIPAHPTSMESEG